MSWFIPWDGTLPLVLSVPHTGPISLSLLLQTGCAHCGLVFSISYSRKDSEAAGARTRLRDLEGQLNSKEALLATTVSEKRSLEASLADLQEQMQEVLPAAAPQPRGSSVSVPVSLVCVCVRFCGPSWTWVSLKPRSSCQTRCCCAWTWRTAARACQRRWTSGRTSTRR